MPTSDGMNISASGLSAQRARLNVIAENIANANTTRTAGGGPYLRRVARLEAETPSFARLVSGEIETRGVRVASIAEVQDVRRVYSPGHPDADRNGYLLMPAINAVAEMTDMMAATRAYEANVTAMQALKNMAQKALELGR